MAKRLAILTGGSAGLGAALYASLKAADFTLIELSRRAPYPESIAVDMAQPDAFRSTLQRALAQVAEGEWNEILTIGNAGSLHPMGPSQHKASEDVLASAHLNFVSAVMFMSAVLGRFEATSARKVLINISSGAALRGKAGWSLYCAAKAGVENFVRSVALEQAALASPFLVVNVDPGVMDTAMQTAIRNADAGDFPDREQFVARMQRGELRDPHKVAAAVLHIAAMPDLVGGQRYIASDYIS